MGISTGVIIMHAEHQFQAINQLYPKPIDDESVHLVLEHASCQSNALQGVHSQ